MVNNNMLKNKTMKLKGINTNFFPKNQRGWIKIVEAFTAILLIMGVVLIVIDKGYVKKEDFSLEIYKKGTSILKEIQLNDTFRENILSVDSLPVEWDEFDSKGLGNVKSKIIERTPNYLDCKAKVCSIDDDCILAINFDKDVYVQSVAIIANLEIYSPRQLKLFCWEK
ncbi:MAG: hypothetical protein KJ721_01360 [Nanoarchaeota archaeon]|nr:hypothetical protein [Nanoarchaeota archaeon]